MTIGIVLNSDVILLICQWKYYRKWSSHKFWWGDTCISERFPLNSIDTFICVNNCVTLFIHIDDDPKIRIKIRAGSRYKNRHVWKDSQDNICSSIAISLINKRVFPSRINLNPSNVLSIIDQYFFCNIFLWWKYRYKIQST